MYIKNRIISVNIQNVFIIFQMYCVYTYILSLTGDELFSDSYPISVVEDFFFEVVGKVN